jgi:hypothetical protein
MVLGDEIGSSHRIREERQCGVVEQQKEKFAGEIRKRAQRKKAENAGKCGIRENEMERIVQFEVLRGKGGECGKVVVGFDNYAMESLRRGRRHVDQDRLGGRGRAREHFVEANFVEHAEIVDKAQEHQTGSTREMAVLTDLILDELLQPRATRWAVGTKRGERCGIENGLITTAEKIACHLRCQTLLSRQ